MIKINPFKPNSPVHPEMFVGRTDEIHLLEAALHHTRAGNPTHFLITGERGIGKSSLLNFAKFLAEGGDGIRGRPVSFLVVDTDIEKNTTLPGLIAKISFGLDRVLARYEPVREYARKAFEFLTRVEAAGIKVGSKERPETIELLSEQFIYSLSDIVKRICVANTVDGPQCDGVLILIDEADNASKDLALGSFLKIASERLVRRGCDRLAFGLAGLTPLRSVLEASHPSAPRIFQECSLGRLSAVEANKVIDSALKRATNENLVTTKISDEARSSLVWLSEGYPHFIQQFGYSAFATDTDNNIDNNDVLIGAFGKGGAMQAIGDKYYRDNFYRKIQKDSYRQVLRLMADNLDSWVTKRELKKKFSGSESVLDNALKALRDRQIILSKEGERGTYRLQHKGFAWWIKVYTNPPQELRGDIKVDVLSDADSQGPA